MPTLTINGQEVTVENGKTVMQACKEIGIEIPHFCYHERLSIAGNCRMCLVEMERSPKPIASCAMPAGDGMVIHTNTELVKKAREGVMEFLLINHPLDCPICDQGGECDLQDQSMAYGGGDSRYHEVKRAVVKKDMGPLIETEMTRCIHCMRCVRFATEVAGVDDMGALYRGENSQITTYLDSMLDSEVSGNVIDLCPVGALTNKPYSFTARSWELTDVDSVDVMDALGSNIVVNKRVQSVMRILPRENDGINEEWISDKTRFAYDGLRKNRLDQPYVKKKGKLAPASWGEAFDAIKKNLKDVKGDALAAVVGDLADMESMKALQDLLAGLGSKRIECRQDGAAIDPKNRVNYLFNSGLQGIENADYILLLGTNPRVDAPLLNTRLRKAVKAGAKVANIGPAMDLTYVVEEHGDNAAMLNDAVAGKGPLVKALKAAKRPALIVGQGALVGTNGAAILNAAQVLANKYCIKADWNGFNMLHKAASRVAALDLGLTTAKGIKGITADAETGKIKAVFLLGADEFDTSCLKNTFTVYLGTHGDEGVKNADVVLPAAAFTEKSGTYINTEGRVQRVTKAVNPPGDAREDWTILRALSDSLDCVLGYDTLEDLRKTLSLTDIGVKPSEKWGAVTQKGTIAKTAKMHVSYDLYQTNPIVRASSILREVEAAIAGEAEEATGTNG